jgi:hypothetical protein
MNPLPHDVGCLLGSASHQLLFHSTFSDFDNPASLCCIINVILDTFISTERSFACIHEAINTSALFPFLNHCITTLLLV